ncbi:MAG: hypothetical protein IPP71_00235 [Bacteroidetes bacterium]|nr:hypothetical protein [Bacteroidota bacterium]
MKELNLGGIDMSIDYRKSEENCELFTRGKHFNMGVKGGKLAIAFKLKSKNRKILTYRKLQDMKFQMMLNSETIAFTMTLLKVALKYL